MAKFLFVYRGSVEASQKQPSPEEMQEIMGQWGAWFGQLGEAVIDGGDALLPMGKVVKADAPVTDGPFIEAKEMVGGYSIIQADDLDQAAEHAKGCPVVAEGGSVEIRELAGYADAEG